MSNSLSDSIGAILQTIWRRRRLAFLPILIILPLGLLYAQLAPKTYVAKSLLLLQEQSQDHPLSRDAPSSGRMLDRIAGLQTLLKSDRVLQRVMNDIADEKTSSNPAMAVAWIKAFSNSLYLDLVGNHFLELRLHGPAPHGLAQQLDTVTERFLEALLSSQDSPNATQVLIASKRARLIEAELAYTRFKEQTRADASRLESQNALLEQGEKRLATLAAELNAARSQASSGDNASESSSGSTKSGSEGSAENPNVVRVKQIESRQGALKAEVLQLERSVATLAEKMRQVEATDQRLLANQASAREAYQEYARHYVTPDAGKSSGILNAPERIKLIDRPTDPKLPERSALKIILAAVAASLVGAIGLVLVCHLFDPTIRSGTELERITSVPIIARLPAA